MALLDPRFFQIIILIFVFAIGACIGSLINVVVARLPLEKSIIWPGSRCGSCWQPIRGICNIPIFSYLILGGKCRSCKARFSSRYLWVELFTAVSFTGLFYLEIIANWNDFSFVKDARVELQMSQIPWRALALFVHHAVLLSFLIAASLCDLDGQIIPLSLTAWGTVVGLVFATLCPWPWPNPTSPDSVLQPGMPWGMIEFTGKIPRGIYAWPVWGPLPDWLPPGSWQLGLATGLTGAAVGNLMMRSVKFVFEKGMGREALGLGDADLMMMAGAFVGWQMTVVAFFVGAFAGFFFAIPNLISKGERRLAFGPGLAIGVMFTLLAWPVIGVTAQLYFFDWLILFTVATFLGGGMFIGSLLLRFVGRKG